MMGRACSQKTEVRILNLAPHAQRSNSMRKSPIIMIRHPDAGGLALLTSMLTPLGNAIIVAADELVADRLMERLDIDLILAGLHSTNGDAREWLTSMRRKHPHIPVIMLCNRLPRDQARKLLRLGAVTF